MGLKSGTQCSNQSVNSIPVVSISFLHMFQSANVPNLHTLAPQVEGLRNEYNRVTSGSNSKTGSGADDVSQLRQEAQQLQASLVFLLPGS